MIRPLLLAAVLAAPFMPVFGQNSSSTTPAAVVGSPASTQGDPFITGLSLTEDQIKQITAIHTKFRSLMKARLDSTYASAKSQGLRNVTPRLDDLRQRHVEELRASLPEEKRTAFDANVARIESTRAAIVAARLAGTPPTR